MNQEVRFFIFKLIKNFFRFYMIVMTFKSFPENQVQRPSINIQQSYQCLINEY